MDSGRSVGIPETMALSTAVVDSMGTEDMRPEFLALQVHQVLVPAPLEDKPV